jgi:hypothetical protein
MARDDWRPRQDEESRRMLGVRIRNLGPRSGEDEPKRVLGFPVADSIGPTAADVEWFKSWLHPIRMCRRWLRRRHLGPYDPDPDP